MDPARKQKFIGLWNRYFPGADLPLTFYFTDEPGLAEKPEAHRCFLGQLASVRQGCSLYFSVDSVECHGGKRYLGFSQELMPKFEYFLSCGIPGEMEGERYKKSPEMVKKIVAGAPAFLAPSRYLVSKRWDCLDVKDEPEVVVFFAAPDVLSGLFTLAGFDETDVDAVFAPFCAGCGSIVQHPYLERGRERPRAVLGLFDVSARPWVPRETLTFAVPMQKFERMVDNIEESFLTTASWSRVRTRL